MPTETVADKRPTEAAALATLKGLGDATPGRALAAGWADPSLCSAIRTRFKPTDMVWQGPPPAPAPRGVVRIERVEDLAEQERFDLILCGPEIGHGSLAGARRRMGVLADRLAPKGVALMALDTYAQREAAPAPLEALLFPAQVSAGLVSEAARGRAPLGAANWLLMLHDLGLTPQAVAGYGDAPVSERDLIDHGPRLALFEQGEVATPRLYVRAVRRRGK